MEIRSLEELQPGSRFHTIHTGGSGIVLDAAMDGAVPVAITYRDGYVVERFIHRDVKVAVA